MSWREAPLYVEAHDLARRVLEWTERWDGPGRVLADTCREVALALVDDVSLALSFPAHRARHLDDADAGIVRLRGRLRLAMEHGLLTPGALRLAEGHLTRAGRMIGGWKRRLPEPAAP